LKLDRAALPGEVLEPAAVTAVDPFRGLPATRAASRAADGRKDEGNSVGLEEALLKFQGGGSRQKIKRMESQHRSSSGEREVTANRVLLSLETPDSPGMQENRF
jgi:hypothetical protein